MKARWPAPRGEVFCDVCGKPLPRAAAVRLGSKWLHPIRCFGARIANVRRQLDLTLGGLK